MENASWQVTAITIDCDGVADEVTIMVNGDWTTSCTGYHRYGQSSRESRKLLGERSKKLKRPLECQGPDCRRVLEYHDKLVREEAARPLSGSD
ncbi:MAG: hypothetical protein WC369_08185 [Dehalococcoidales bacterium]|jgi:hypothetical protein